jgi:hypothetical protein
MRLSLLVESRCLLPEVADQQGACCTTPLVSPPPCNSLAGHGADSAPHHEQARTRAACNQQIRLNRIRRMRPLFNVVCRFGV